MMKYIIHYFYYKYWIAFYLVSKSSLTIHFYRSLFIILLNSIIINSIIINKLLAYQNLGLFNNFFFINNLLILNVLIFSLLNIMMFIIIEAIISIFVKRYKVLFVYFRYLLEISSITLEWITQTPPNFHSYESLPVLNGFEFDKKTLIKVLFVLFSGTIIRHINRVYGLSHIFFCVLGYLENHPIFASIGGLILATFAIFHEQILGFNNIFNMEKALDSKFYLCSKKFLNWFGDKLLPKFIRQYLYDLFSRLLNNSGKMVMGPKLDESKPINMQDKPVNNFMMNNNGKGEESSPSNSSSSADKTPPKPSSSSLEQPSRIKREATSSPTNLEESQPTKRGRKSSPVVRSPNPYFGPNSPVPSPPKFDDPHTHNPFVASSQKSPMQSGYSNTPVQSGYTNTPVQSGDTDPNEMATLYGLSKEWTYMGTTEEVGAKMQKEIDDERERIRTTGEPSAMIDIRELPHERPQPVVMPDDFQDFINGRRLYVTKSGEYKFNHDSPEIQDMLIEGFHHWGELDNRMRDDLAMALKHDRGKQRMAGVAKPCIDPNKYPEGIRHLLIDMFYNSGEEINEKTIGRVQGRWTK